MKPEQEFDSNTQDTLECVYALWRAHCLYLYVYIHRVGCLCMCVWGDGQINNNCVRTGSHTQSLSQSYTDTEREDTRAVCEERAFALRDVRDLPNRCADRCLDAFGSFGSRVAIDAFYGSNIFFVY